MNFLALVNRLFTECDVTGGPLVTTAGQTGRPAQMVLWINQAWLELQEKHADWDWLRSSNLLGAGASFATVAGQASYPLGTGLGTCGVSAATFGKWDRETFRNYTTTAGVTNEMYLDFVPYDTWRDAYMFGAMRAVETRPTAFTIGPDRSICLGPPPNGLYTVTGDYFLAPTQMVQDTDLPAGLENSKFHMAIVYKAMMFYGADGSAPEVFQRGQTGYNSLLREMEFQYVPELTFGGALA